MIHRTHVKLQVAQNRTLGHFTVFPVLSPPKKIALDIRQTEIRSLPITVVLGCRAPQLSDC
jgi:hypothetical protein